MKFIPQKISFTIMRCQSHEGGRKLTRYMVYFNNPVGNTTNAVVLFIVKWKDRFYLKF